MLYLWIKAFHIISVIAWMAGLFYLPRLFVYHADAEKGSVQSETFKVMERRLLRIIMNPAMILTWGFGLTLAWLGNAWSDGWLHAKLALVLIMTLFHMWMAGCRRRFAEDANTYTAGTYRMANELPTLLMVGIVILAVVKPF